MKVNQARHKTMLKEMMTLHSQGKKAAITDTKLQKRTWKEHFEKVQPKFKDMLKERIEKKRVSNLKKLNKIKIKVKKI